MNQSNSFTCDEDCSSHHYLTYPATHALIEIQHPPQTNPSHTVTLKAAAWHVRQIVDHAVNVGDHATAALMTEAFARMALHARAMPRQTMTRSAQMREYTALREVALGLLASTYPSHARGCDLECMDRFLADVEVSN